MSNHSSIIQALLIERIGYERRGRLDRVAQVDEVLRQLGADVPVETATIDVSDETATRKKPTKRKRG